jgi:exodeoxyribonuclease VII small subunit
MSKTISIKDLLSESDLTEQISGLSFEAGLSLLEELVAKVESGQLPLEQAILAYERGVLILNKLREQISGVEQKLKVIEKNTTKTKSKNE